MRSNTNRRMALVTATGIILFATTLKADFYSEYGEAFKVYEEARYALDQKNYDSASLTFIEAKSKFDTICKRYPNKDISKIKKYIKSCDNSVGKIKDYLTKMEERKKAESAKRKNDSISARNNGNIQVSGSSEVKFLKESLLKLMRENDVIAKELKSVKLEIVKVKRTPAKNDVRFTDLMRINGELEKRNTSLTEQIIQLKSIIKKGQNKSDYRKLMDKETQVNSLKDEVKILTEQNELLKGISQKSNMNKSSLEFDVSKLKTIITAKENELILIKKRLDKGTGSITKLEDLEALSEENFKLKAKVNNLKNQIIAQSKALESSAKNVKSAANETKLMNENKSLKIQLDKINKDLKLVKVQKTQLESNVSFENSKNKTLTKKLVSLNKELNVEKNKKRNASADELATAKKEVEFNKKVYAELYNDNTNLRKKLLKYNSLAGKVTALTAYKIATDKTLVSVKKENSQFKEQFKSLKADSNRVKTLEIVVKKIKSLNNSNMQKYNKAIDMINKLKEENKSLSGKLKKTIADISKKKIIAVANPVKAKKATTVKKKSVAVANPVKAKKATIVKKKSVAVANPVKAKKATTVKKKLVVVANAATVAKAIIINKGLAKAISKKDKEAILWHCAELLKTANTISNKYLVVDVIEQQKLTKEVPKNLISLLKTTSKGIVYKDIDNAVQKFVANK